MTTELLKEVDETLGEIEFHLGRSIEFQHTWHVLRDKVRTELAARGELPDPAPEHWEKQLGPQDAEQIEKVLKHVANARRVLDSVYCKHARQNGEEHLRRATNTLTSVFDK